jgi:hypothetical protein
LAESWNRFEVAYEWTVRRGHTVRRSVSLLLGLLDDRVLQAFVGPGVPDGLDKDTLLEINWSSTQEQVARAGEALFSSRGRVDLGHAASYWDGRQYRAFKRALEVYVEDADWGKPTVEEIDCPGTTADVTIEQVRLVHTRAAGDLLFRARVPCGSDHTVRFPSFDGQTQLPTGFFDAIFDDVPCDHGSCLRALARRQAVAGEDAGDIYARMQKRGEAEPFLRELSEGSPREQKIAERLQR